MDLVKWILWSAFWLYNCLLAHLELGISMLMVCLGSSTLNTWAAIYLHWSVQAAWIRTKPRTLPSIDQDEAFVMRLKHLKIGSGFSLSLMPFRSTFFCSLVVQGILGTWFQRHMEEKHRVGNKIKKARPLLSDVHHRNVKPIAGTAVHNFVFPSSVNGVNL